MTANLTVRLIKSSDGKKLFVYSPYDPTIISIIKSFKSKWNADLKWWEISYSKLDLSHIVECFNVKGITTTIEGDLKDDIACIIDDITFKSGRADKITAVKQGLDTTVLIGVKEKIKLVPRERQIDGVKFLNATGGCGIIGDKVGLGKTLQAIMFATLNNLRTLVVCPSHLKSNWSDEIALSTYGATSRIIKSGDIITKSDNVDYTIVNYDLLMPRKTGTKSMATLESLTSAVLDGQYDCVIIDECVVGETKIALWDGRTLTVNEIMESTENFEVVSYNERTKKVEPKSILRKWCSGEKPTIEITTARGETLECTDNHLIYTQKGYVEAKDLTTKDSVLLYNKHSTKYDKRTKSIDLWKFVGRWVYGNSRNGVPSIHSVSLPENIHSGTEAGLLSEEQDCHNSGIKGLCKIATIKKTGRIRLVYDLTVEDNHNFFANGMLVHNCQKMKDKKTKWTKYIHAVLSEIKTKVLLSATPIRNRPMEYFSPLSFLDPHTWNDAFAYGMRYCDGHRVQYGRHGGGWDFSGATNLDELHERTKPYILRREFDPEMPKVVPHNVRIELDANERARYNAIKEEFKHDIGLAMFHKLCQYTTSVLYEPTKNIIDSIVDSGEKVIVFSRYTDILNDLYVHYNKRSVICTGNQTAENRHHSNGIFQTDKTVQVLFAQYEAAGTGLTLTAASKEILINLPLSPVDVEQAIGRVKRMTQSADFVTIYKLYCDDTIDEDIMEINERKEKIIANVVDGISDYKNESNDSVLTEVLKKYTVKPKS